MRHIQHLSLESLVKMDHPSKGATAKFKRDHWGTGGSKRGQYLKGTDRKSPSDRMSAYDPKRTSNATQLDVD